MKRRLVGWLGMIGVLAGLVQPAAARIVEGFEDIDQVTVGGGRLSAVTGGPAVTEGNAAAELSPGATVVLKVPGAELARSGWLRVDVMAAQPVAPRLGLRLSAGRRRFDRTAYAQLPRDTVALPLAVAGAEFAGPWPAGAVTVELSNRGDVPVLIDNVRLEQASPPPAEAVLLDLGPAGQVVWPGFAPGGPAVQEVVWSGQDRVYARNSELPDPLVGDYVGQAPGRARDDHFLLATPGRADARVHLWVTHYGDRNDMPSPQYGLRLEGKTLLRRKLSARQMLGEQGILQGLGGAWTPQWFADTYATTLYDRVAGPASGRSARVEIVGCQVAAVAMAPAASAGLLDAYVRQVHDDLQRYRRQFVVGGRHEPVAGLEPNDLERARGGMLFEPPADRARLASWRPQADERLTTLKLLAANGVRSMALAAVVPLRATPSLQVSLSALRSDDGRSLPLDRERTRVLAIRRVPRVWAGRVEWLPWLVTDRHEDLVEREIALLAVIVQPAASAPAGTYRGDVRILAGGPTIRLPLHVEVLDVGSPAGDGSWTASAERVTADDVYHTLAAGLSSAQRRALTGRLQRFVVSAGLEGMVVPGPVSTRFDKINDSSMTAALRTAPIRELSAPTLIDLSYPLRRLGWQRVPAGSLRYRKLLRQMVASADRLARQSRLGPHYHYLGSPWRADQLQRTVSQAGHLARAGGQPVATLHTRLVDPSDRRRFQDVIQPMSALILLPRDSRTAELARLHRQVGGDRPLLLAASRPDRFQTGILPAQLRMAGCYVQGLFMAGSPYGGFDVGRTGVFVPQRDGSFGLTVLALDLWRGMDDRKLIEHARRLAEAAKAAGKPATEIELVLARGKEMVDSYRPRWDRHDLRYRTPAPSWMKAFREQLIRAVAAVNDRVP